MKIKEKGKSVMIIFTIATILIIFAGCFLIFKDKRMIQQLSPSFLKNIVSANLGEENHTIIDIEENNVTKQVYRIETDEFLIEAPTSPICYWNGRNGKANDNKTCYQELNIYAKEPIKIDLDEKNFAMQFTKNIAKDIKVDLKGKTKIDAGENHTIEFSYTYPVNYGKEKYNLSVNINGNDYIVDPEIDACSVLNESGTLYLLNTSITGSATSYCMNISANNVTLDCQGNTIDGNDAADYGIYIIRGTQQTTNVTVKNCILTDWDTAGVYTYNSNYNYFDNITITSTPVSDSGIYIDDNSDYFVINNSNSSLNSAYGIKIETSMEGNIINSIFDYNGELDVYPNVVEADCNHKFTNVSLSGYPMNYYNNTAVNIQGWTNTTNIYLCNADNSVLNNITMNGSGYGTIYLDRVANSTFTNIRITNLKYGIFDVVSTSSRFVNINITNCSANGVIQSGTISSTFINATIYKNYNYGIYLDGNNHVITDSNISSNGWGVDANPGGHGVYVDDDGCNITNSRFEYQSGVDGGIYLGTNCDTPTISNNTFISNGWGIYIKPGVDNGRFYNNYFTGSGFSSIRGELPFTGTPNFYNNIFNDTSYGFERFLNAKSNTTQSTATNIIGVPAYGGNYWTNSSGTGYSDTCTDSTGDGFCDSPYNTSNKRSCTAGVDCGVNADFLALSNEYVFDNDYPIFSNYWDDNASLIDTGTGLFNVTVTSTNGTVLLEIDGNNVTATNLTADVYNASYDFTSGAIYTYYWHSWGNGTSHKYNISNTRSYTVNSSAVDCWTTTNNIIYIPNGCVYSKLNGVST